MKEVDFRRATAAAPIGIVGAGIAGLVLALQLKGLGLPSIVFEARSRDSVIHEGAFLTLAPNAINGLRAVGLDARIAAAAIVSRGMEFLDERGIRLGFADQSYHAEEFGAPSVTIARGVLMRLLLTACEQAGIDVHFDSAIEELVDVGEHVQLVAGGNIKKVVWVAACDGLGSQTRRRIFPDFPTPRFTGLIGTGGIAMIDAVGSTDNVMRMVFGHVGFFGYLKRGDGPVYWFNSFPAEHPNSSGSTIARLRALHRADPSFVQAILAGIPEPVRDYPLFDMPVLPIWHRDKVVLVGDAAHAVGPHAGQGAAMAIEDAVTLAACMRATSSLEAGFRRFEALRRPRVETVAKVTARNRQQKRAATRVERWLRRLILPHVLPAGIKSIDALCAYRVELDPCLAMPASHSRIAA